MASPNKISWKERADKALAALVETLKKAGVEPPLEWNEMYQFVTDYARIKDGAMQLPFCDEHQSVGHVAWQQCHVRAALIAQGHDPSKKCDLRPALVY